MEKIIMAAIVAIIMRPTSHGQTLSRNPFLWDSTSNPFSDVGSPFGIDSVNNPFSPQGSPFSLYSANNPFGKGVSLDTSNPEDLLYGVDDKTLGIDPKEEIKLKEVVEEIQLKKVVIEVPKFESADEEAERLLSSMKADKTEP